MKSNQRFRYGIVWTAIGFALTGGAVRADDAPDRGMAELSALVEQINAEVEQLRFEMGKPKIAGSTLGIDNATPRTLYYQALTLFDKSNRLCFEITREERPEPERPREDIRLEHVNAVAQEALERIHRTKKYLNITAPCAKPESNATMEVADVLAAIVRANRQLNLLLDHPFAPEDVFQRVTLALSYATGLRSQYPGRRMPATPSYEHGKVPADVYNRLLGCLSQVRTISSELDPDAMAIDVTAIPVSDITPSDVYDIASLLVAELSALYRASGSDEPPFEVYAPGRKFPSHVYQRAGVLEAQLTEILSMVHSEPDQTEQRGAKQ